MMPVVSVVIPLYNKRSTFLRTLKSVRCQNLADFEVIVVDDGSTDGGGELVAEIQDPRFKVIKQLNAGPGAAKNRGTAEAQSDLITFLDADDEWDSDFLKLAVQKLEKYHQCDAFVSDVFLGESREQTLWTRECRDIFWEGSYQLEHRADLRNILSAFSSCGVVFRRSILIRYGGFFDQQHCTLGEDVFLWLQVLLNHKIYRSVKPMATYHLENSELGIGSPSRNKAIPIEPVLTHVGTIRRSAPPRLHTWLENWLAMHAMRSAFLQCQRGDATKAASLVRRFPRMFRWPIQSLKLIIRIIALRLGLRLGVLD